MTLRVRWLREAEKDTRSVPVQELDRIVRAIGRYAETGHGDVKRLAGGLVGEYRLRVGDWRVRFALDSARIELVVLRVLPRGSAYRE